MVYHPDKETLVLNDTVDQMDLTDKHRIFHPKTVEYIFFLSTYGTFFRIDFILGHKTNLNIFKNTEIISSNFLDQNFMRQKPTTRKKSCKKHKHGS